MIVGVTGGIGSGKSTVVKLFSNFENNVVYLADDHAKMLMNSSNEIKQRLISEFSSEVYLNNELNRSFLANIVFNNKEKLAILNSVVHPVVHRHFQNFIEKNSSKSYILYENAILFENGSDKLCDKIITVTAPKNIRIDRVVMRDKTTKKQVECRMKNQWNDMRKIIQSNYVIENIDLKDVEIEVERIHGVLTKS